MAVDLIVSAGPDPTRCRALLACNHYAQPHHVASSVFDFPAAGTRCPTCKEVMPLHPRLIAALSA